jgi:hypothetical protein
VSRHCRADNDCKSRYVRVLRDFEDEGSEGTSPEKASKLPVNYLASETVMLHSISNTNIYTSTSETTEAFPKSP